MKIAAAVLAAGASTRLGLPKQLLLLDGETLVAHTIRLAFECGARPVLAIVGCEAERIAPHAERAGALCVVNPEWREGVASSVRAAIHGVAHHTPETDNLLLLVCDQPKLTTNHLAELIALHRKGTAPITASRYAGTVGVPAIFHKTAWPQLQSLKGDRGASALFRKDGQFYPPGVEFPGGEVDIDLPADAQVLRDNADPQADLPK